MNLAAGGPDRIQPITVGMLAVLESVTAMVNNHKTDKDLFFAHTFAHFLA